MISNFRSYILILFFSLNTSLISQVNMKQKEFVPQWAKSAIWYQIFPERFRNGDTSNDPTLESILGADPQEPPVQWQVHPWGSDWYKLQPYEKANGEKLNWKHLLRRRYGGDIQGILDKLDYLVELGINAIYLNPVFEAPSLHKYDGATYHHIDPHFGPDPEGDKELIKSEDPVDPKTWVWTKADKLMLKLIEECHKRKIRIIFDGVFNHMGINSFAFQDVKKNQQKSKYKDWFIIKSWDDPEKGTKFTYEGWWNVKSLPELREDENGIVDGPRQYIFNATRRWMNPDGKGVEYGIDGWRLDVAFCVAHPFWKEWRKLVKSINPDAYLTAEIIDKPENVKPYLEGDEFDAEMNYNFAFTCAEFFFNEGKKKINATEFDRKLKELREMYPEGVAYVNQNLFGSHDANRIGSHIVNRKIDNFRDWGKYFSLSKALENPDYKVRKPTPKELELQKLFVIFQFTYVGAPMIYYGDEVGMWGANDPDCRKPMIWDDIIYEDEKYNPDGTTRKPDKVCVNYDLLNHYKKLISIRNKYKALRLGDYNSIFIDNKKQIYGFLRTYENENIAVIINNSRVKREVDFSKTLKGNWSEILNNYKIKNGKLIIEPLNGAILVLK